MEIADFKILSSPATYVNKEKMIAYRMGKEYKVEPICLEVFEIYSMRIKRLLKT